jgi:hypothetical protein
MQKDTLFGIISKESPSHTVPDSTFPITTIPFSLNLSIIGILQGHTFDILTNTIHISSPSKP